MNICDNDHDEIAYNEKNCPLCSCSAMLDKLLDENHELREEIKNIERA